MKSPGPKFFCVFVGGVVVAAFADRGQAEEYFRSVENENKKMSQIWLIRFTVSEAPL